MLGGKLDKHVFERRTHFMNLDMSDANFAQLFLDLRALDCFIDEQMHRPKIVALRTPGISCMAWSAAVT